MKQRNIMVKIITFVITLSVVMSFALMMSGNTGIPTRNQIVRQLTVHGNGVVTVEPDIAILTLSVVTRGRDTSIQRENSETMDRVIEAVKDAGIEDADIQTLHYFMTTDHDWSASRMTMTVVGYIIHNSIRVTVRDIDKVGEILALAESAGANEIGGVIFSVSNTDELYMQALEKAVADARTKAGVIARAAGVTLGSPLSIIEGMNFNHHVSRIMPMPMFSSADMALMGAGWHGVGIEPGEISITASVTITFEF